MGARRRRPAPQVAVAPIRVPQDQSVDLLAHEITNPDRDYPVVATTAHSALRGPFVDPIKLAAAVGENAPVYVLSAQAAGHLARKLPARLDVYGGATRVWTRWPPEGVAVDEQRHPLFLTYSDEAADDTIRNAVKFVQERALAWTITPLKPAPRVIRTRERQPLLPVGVTPASMPQRKPSPGTTRSDPPGAPSTERSTILPAERSNVVELASKAPTGTDHGQAEALWEELASVRDTLEQSRAELSSTQEQIGVLNVQLGQARADLKAARHDTAQARADANRHTAQLSTARAERADLDQLAATTRGELNAANRVIRNLERKVAHMEAKLHGRDVFPSDPERQFRHEVYLAWLHATTEHDREARPLPGEWFIGSDFLDSVEALDGVSRNKIISVVTEVLTGLVWEMSGRQAHPHRVSSNGSAPQQAREDGATGWRCALQVKTASARRLMWWVLPAGQIELGRVALHDDTTLN